MTKRLLNGLDQEPSSTCDGWRRAISRLDKIFDVDAVSPTGSSVLGNDEIFSYALPSASHVLGRDPVHATVATNGVVQYGLKYPTPRLVHYSNPGTDDVHTKFSWLASSDPPNTYTLDDTEWL